MVRRYHDYTPGQDQRVYHGQHSAPAASLLVCTITYHLNGAGVGCPLQPYYRPGSMRLAVLTLVATRAAARDDRQWACRPPHDGYAFCNTSLALSSRLASLMALLPPADVIANTYAQPWATGGSSSLGIPGAVWWNEATHQATNGKNYPTTMFPMPSITSCAFNFSLVRDIANVVGREGRAASNLGAGGFDYWCVRGSGVGGTDGRRGRGRSGMPLNAGGVRTRRASPELSRPSSRWVDQTELA